MIFTRYQDFRPGFALPGAPTVDDGYPEWPVAKLRTGGFDGTIALRTAALQTYTLVAGSAGPLLPTDPTSPTFPSYPIFPIRVTCNAVVADVDFEIDDFHWFLSQRNQPVRAPLATGPASADSAQYFFADRLDMGRSGTFILELNEALAAELLSGAGASTAGILESGTVTSYSLQLLFRDVAIYSRRNADSAIQWARFVDHA